MKFRETERMSGFKSVFMSDVKTFSEMKSAFMSDWRINSTDWDAGT